MTAFRGAASRQTWWRRRRLPIAGKPHRLCARSANGPPQRRWIGGSRVVAASAEELVRQLTQRMLRKKLYVILSKGEATAEQIGAALPQHLEYMIGLEKTGVLFASGPLSANQPSCTAACRKSSHSRQANSTWSGFLVSCNAHANSLRNVAS